MINDHYGHIAYEAIKAARKHVIGVAKCFTSSYYRGRDLDKWGNHYGGCFCLMSNSTGKVILLTFIGKPEAKKWDKYMRLAQEKAQRLFKHPSDTTSWDSRDDAKERYPGAVRGTRYIYSFSGFPAYGDTLAMACVAEEIEHLMLSPQGRLEPEMWLSANDRQARNAAVTYALYREEVAKGHSC